MAVKQLLTGRNFLDAGRQPRTENRLFMPSPAEEPSVPCVATALGRCAWVHAPCCLWRLLTKLLFALMKDTVFHLHPSVITCRTTRGNYAGSNQCHFHEDFMSTATSEHPPINSDLVTVTRTAI